MGHLLFVQPLITVSGGANCTICLEPPLFGWTIKQALFLDPRRKHKLLPGAVDPAAENMSGSRWHQCPVPQWYTTAATEAKKWMSAVEPKDGQMPTDAHWCPLMCALGPVASEHHVWHILQLTNATHQAYELSAPFGFQEPCSSFFKFWTKEPPFTKHLPPPTYLLSASRHLPEKLPHLRTATCVGNKSFYNPKTCVSCILTP